MGEWGGALDALRCALVKIRVILTTRVLHRMAALAWDVFGRKRHLVGRRILAGSALAALGEIFRAGAAHIWVALGARVSVVPAAARAAGSWVAAPMQVARLVNVVTTILVATSCSGIS